MKCKGGRRREEGRGRAGWWQGSASKKPFDETLLRAGTPALPTGLLSFLPAMQNYRVSLPLTDCGRGWRCKAGRWLCLLLLVALPVRAGEILGGRFKTVPDALYVNQAFEIHFELEVTFGSEVEDVRITDFPNNPELITVGRLETAVGSRVTRGTQTFTVHRFIAKARCHQPIDRVFQPHVHCMLVERRNAGFFSHWQSFPKQKPLEPFTLRVRPLPEAGRPADFSGAIGHFRLNGRLSQHIVQPGDIITLSLDLVGEGWLGDRAAMPVPPASPLFKSYPPKELLREAAHLKSEQVFIPQSTNATEIAAARFSFFNPATERYEESVAGPFRLTFGAAPAAAAAEEVRVIDTARPAVSAVQAQLITREQVDQTLRHSVPLLVAGGGVLAAFFVFFLLAGTHRVLAAGVGLLILAGGLGMGYRLRSKTTLSTRHLARRAEVRFAPSQTGAPLFTLNPGSTVVPLEQSGPWVRIDAAGRCGWIHADTLKHDATP